LTVFIDAGGWISVTIRTDQHHKSGRAHFEAMMDLGARTVTSDFVLDEVITRLRYDVGHAAASEFLGLIRHAEEAGILKIRRIDQSLWVEAEAIFLRYADVRLSFTDCTSFALLQAEPVDEVFGFDGHFRMMGHVLQPTP
jgi:uncharacterized protein